MTDIPVFRFKPDARLRHRLYVPETMAFPAKAHLGMMLEIFERHTEAWNPRKYDE